MTTIPEGFEFEAAYLKLTKALARMGREAKDLNAHPDPDYPEKLEYLVNQVMDSAHEIIDLAHDLKHAALAKHKESSNAA
jgi:hypothetical protein